MLIHLNGMPGVGKLTIAKILAENLPAYLLDNHTLINAAKASGQLHGSNGYRRMIQAITDLVYTDLAGNTTLQNLVLTNSLTDKSESERIRFQAVVNLAKNRNDLFVPVLIHCELQENQRRLVNPERAIRQKLTDAQILKVAQDKTILHPADHENALALDTTNLSPSEAAHAIIAHIQSRNLF